jgi:hypothetical protein
LCYPKDFIGSAILYAASVSIGNSVQVRVKHGWTESGTLYIVLVGPPGSIKSHTISYGIQPLLDKDELSFIEYKKQKKVYDELVSMSKKERIESGMPEPVKPVYAKSIISDATPEALAEVHQNNLRGIGSCNDELAGWFKNFNRYHNGNEMEFWLSNWSGKPIIIDRKSGEPIFIKKPSISVCGTIQDGILKELSKGRNKNGFMERILFAYPDKTEKPYWSNDELDDKISIYYHTVIENLLRIKTVFDESNNPKSILLDFTQDALAELYQWQRTNTDLINSAPEAEASIYTKLEIYCIRFSLLIQLLKYACSESGMENIEADSVRSAISLTEYFRHTALKVQKTLNRTPLDSLDELQLSLYKALPEVFKTAEGLEAAAALKIHERTYKRYIDNSTIYKKIRHGEYQKLY